MNLGKMTLTLKTMAVAAIFSLSGCTIDQDVGHMRSGIDNFTYIQWNTEYAVTVKHVKKLDTTVYISDDYNLQFFKHTSLKVPKWNNFITNDPAIVSGYVNGKYRILKGNDMGVTLQQGQSLAPAYRAVDVTIVPGMSGGPVHNTDGEVIGMIVEPLLEKLSYGEKDYSVSIYLPYSLIQQEWDKYEAIAKIKKGAQ
jgi:hypothetical protein